MACCYHRYHSSSRIGSGLLAPLVTEMTLLNILFFVAAFSGADPELFVEFDGRRVSTMCITTVSETLSFLHLVKVPKEAIEKREAAEHKRRGK